MKSQIEWNHLEPDGTARTKRFEHSLSSFRTFYAQAPDPSDTESYPLTFDYHQGMEIGILLEGQMLRQFEDLSYVAIPGDVWLCGMWEPHGWEGSVGHKYTLVVFLPEFIGDESFDGISWLSMFAVPPRERPRVTTEEMRREMLAIGRELGQVISEKRRAWTAAVRLNLLRVFLLLMQNWETAVLSKQTRELCTRDLSLISPALEIVHSDPSCLVSVSKAAHLCGLSKFTFTRKFQHAMGMTFHRFQLRVKTRLGGKAVIIDAIIGRGNRGPGRIF